MNIAGLASTWSPTEHAHAMSGASSIAPPADPVLSEMRSSVQQQSQNFKGLRTALQAGDLAGAQSAFVTLQQNIQDVSQAAGGRSLFDPNGSIGKDFQTLSSALQAGDLAGAQTAFATFRQDLRSTRHHPAPSAPTNSASTAPRSVPTPGTNGIDTLA